MHELSMRKHYRINFDAALRLAIFTLPPLWTVPGCATVDPKGDYQRTGRQVEQAIGHRPLTDPQNARDADEAVAKLLADGLSADEAVQVALLNNPTAQSVLLSVGMARADVVQAGLWTNPTVGISFRLPEGGGLTNIEAGIAQNIANLWMIPARRRSAQRDLDRTVLTTAQALVSLAIDTKLAYYNALAADTAVTIARDNVALTRQLLGVTTARLEAGAVGSLDVNLAKGRALQAEVDQKTARLQSAAARRTLATLMGLTECADSMELIDPLPAPMDSEPDVERLVALALSARLDIRAAEQSVESAAARVELELAKIFPNVQIGVELERNAQRAQPGRKILADTARASIANGGLTAPSLQSRGERRLAASQRIEAILGPSLSLTLPVFDQNQAQIAKARMAYLQSRATLESLNRAVVQQTRQAADALATAWNIATLYQQEVLPQAQETLKISQASYHAGSAPILNVIDAQRSLLQTRQAYVAALQSAAIALIELERTTARPSRELLNGAGPSQAPMQMQPSRKE